jgi:hypothetical protein
LFLYFIKKKKEEEAGKNDKEQKASVKHLSLTAAP